MLQNFISLKNQLMTSSKKDEKDVRLGHLVSFSQNDSATGSATGSAAEKLDFCLIGYPDDEGIQLNGGRKGAAQGPSEIRKFLYKMTPPLALTPAALSSTLKTKEDKKISDLGDLNPSLTLKEKHDAVQKKISSCLKNSSRFISFGGGHDFGFPDGAGFLDHCHSQKMTKPLIINFDAHLDVRPLDKGLSSGTPFFRLLEQYKDFDFAEVGIQAQCNSQHHYNWCLDKKAKIICYDEIRQSQQSLFKTLQKRLDPWLTKDRPCFVSVDIDAFSSSYAPGCSQSWPIGLLPDEFLECFEYLISNLSVLGLGLYEVSPPLDDDDSKTAKLAALIAHRFIYHA